MASQSLSASFLPVPELDDSGLADSILSLDETSPATGNAHRILLVDDDPDIRSLVRAFLQAEGYEVFSCGDGIRASTLFRTRDDIDLLLTDLRMPEVSGLELANTLAALRPSLPVLFMSGAILEPDEENAVQSNGWRFLAKPFLVPELLGAVHDLLATTYATAQTSA